MVKFWRWKLLMSRYYFLSSEEKKKITSYDRCVEKKVVDKYKGSIIFCCFLKEDAKIMKDL